MTTTRRKPEFTVAAFQRSHGKKPSGIVGHWFVQAATSRAAFDSDLVGEPVEMFGTLAQVATKAQVRFRGAAFVAVLP